MNTRMYLPACVAVAATLCITSLSAQPATIDNAGTPMGFSLIPAGSFRMGDQSRPLVGESDEIPVRTVQVSAFYMGKYEVTKEEWDAVRAWGLNHGYTDLPTGNGSAAAKGANHPVHSISWYAMVKWCNARSEKENLTPCYTVSGSLYKTGNSAPVCNWNANGYRLPSEAEWEKAARGGLSAQNFPWGNTINHNNANYRANGSAFRFDTSGYTTDSYHPFYRAADTPCTAPVDSFPPNGFGLHNMSGNVWEWCWDWYARYGAGSQTDPRGPATGSDRVGRGGGWVDHAKHCRVAAHRADNPFVTGTSVGFRTARSVVAQKQKGGTK